MLVYLHGFNSSPASHKSQVMGRYLAGQGRAGAFACPMLPPHADDAIAAIEGAVSDWRTVCLLGSSLGGFYATYLAEKHGCRAVLIQPAVHPHIGLEAYLGPQKNLHTGEPYVLTRAHLEAWRRLFVQTVDPEKYLLLLETGDEVLDYREAVKKYEGARMVIRQGGDHSLQSFEEHIPRILRFAGL